ncbi:hypothetical protein [Haliangium ochraceum]|uniref:Uncharacterized protein n=1 Tax=Haliangium ochraceum (strain DSM 14365 / JCM 11303 / SMP-2) TaxID=502025 RepID=D0LYK8_HALO1|nr:hypothetical protein [Haliangium ochraceum]ACY17874.1 hypothetical protein Hoch_5390 [Haliangium ochraceum DSM 14365]
MKPSSLSFAALPLLSLALGAGTSAADTLNEMCEKRFMSVTTETFDQSRNMGDWGFDCRTETQPVSGGSPGSYLSISGLATFAPMARSCTDALSVFGGDYRDAEIFAITADFRTYSVSSTTADRPLSLVLVNDAGTPNDSSDDLYVYYVGAQNIPSVNDGWAPFQFPVPANSQTLPTPRSNDIGQTGWATAVGELSIPASDPDAVWNTVIQDVDQVIFWWHDPRAFAFLQDWELGMDNPAVATCAN